MHSWNFLDNLEVQFNLFANLSNTFGWKIWEGFCFPFNCFQVLLGKLSNLNMYAMMKRKSKTENLAQIFGYQTGAVTVRHVLGAPN